MEPLIYIEQKEKDEATLLLKGFTNPLLRKRIFINALGAELLMKYLAQEGISVNNVYNMHNIFKIREEFDVADVMLPNIHIDVRVVYDKDIIFVPKSHFENNLVPDVYVVFNMAQDSTHVDFLGFIRPENIDKSKQNSDYYFVDKEQLVHPFEFVDFVRNFGGNTTEVFSDDMYSDALALIDNDITDTKKRELINALKKSSALREEMIEFDNFEWLSFNASNEDIIDAVTPDIPVVDEFDLFEEKDDFGFEDTSEKQENSEDLLGNDELNGDLVDDLADLGLIAEELSENITDDSESAEIPEVSTEDISGKTETLEMPEDLSEGITGDIEPLEMSEELSSDITDDIETIEMPEDLSIDFENNESLDSEDLIEMPEMEVSDELASEEEPEAIENTVDGDETEMVDLPSETYETNDNLTGEETTEETEELVDMEEPLELSEEMSELSGEVEEGGLTEELENFTEMIDLSEIPATDSGDSENDNVEISEEAVEPTEELINLEMPSEEEIVAEEISNNEAPEETLEELKSFEELDSNADDSDKDNSAETNDSDNELMELETYGNSQAEEFEQQKNVEVTESEPVYEPQAFVEEAYENSTIISSDKQKVGEITIDINVPEQEDLGVLYSNDTVEIENETVKTPEKGKKAVVVAAAAAVVLAASSATYFVMNNKQTEITDAPVVEEPEPLTQEAEQPVPQEEIVKAEVTKVTPAKEVIETPPVQPQPKPIESAYLDIKRMGWAVPDYVTYNDGFKHYLQTLGKSLRLALSSDLLLATEYPYSNQINVIIELSNSGSVSNVAISQSSGSKQIDGIVLQTVKETANVVKPPAGVIVGDKLRMTLKIYL